MGTYKLTRVYVPGLKMGQMTQTIWVTWVTFLEDQVGLPQTKLSGCDMDITCPLENCVGSYLVHK